jgi:hypothetical protein
MTTPNGKSCWSMSPEQHVKAAVANVEEELARHGERLPPKCVTPFSSGHAPWLKETPELKADGVQRFQELIGQLRWAVEIGRVGIVLEMSLLSSHLAMPRAGHLEQAFHVFGCLKRTQRKRLVLIRRILPLTRIASSNVIGLSFIGRQERPHQRTCQSHEARACKPRWRCRDETVSEWDTVVL